MRSVLVGIVLLAAAAQGEQTPSHPSGRYLSALGVANGFLAAWAGRNAEVGIAIMSQRLRKASDEQWLREYMSGLSNPHHQSFEIGRGKEVRSGRFAFPVTLYEAYHGESKGWGYASTIEVVRDGETWRVDRLPRTSDNSE